MFVYSTLYSSLVFFLLILQISYILRIFMKNWIQNPCPTSPQHSLVAPPEPLMDIACSSMLLWTFGRHPLLSQLPLLFMPLLPKFILPPAQLELLDFLLCHVSLSSLCPMQFPVILSPLVLHIAIVLIIVEGYYIGPISFRFHLMTSFVPKWSSFIQLTGESYALGCLMHHFLHIPKYGFHGLHLWILYHVGPYLRTFLT
jgi:hypothetical protein